MAQPFVWGGNGQQLSYEQTKKRREVADALAAKGSVPQTFGAGLNRIGEALLAKSYGDQATASETSGADGRKAVIDALLANPDAGITDMAGALGNDWVSNDPGSTAVIQALMAQKTQQMQRGFQIDDRNAGWEHDAGVLNDQRTHDAPIRDLQLQSGQQGLDKGALELEALRNPKPEFNMVPADEVQALGLPAGAYQRGADGKIYEVGGGGINVNTGDGAPGLGKLSTDYGYVLDPQTREPKIDPVTGLPTAAAVPGSPAALEAAAVAAKAGAGGDSNAITTDTITAAAGLARTLAQKGGTTGMLGQALSNLSETDAAELRRQVKVLTSNATIESLNAMRRESPTGGALGNVTEGEGQMLAASAGAIDPNAKTEDFMRQLSDYERTVLRVVNGKDAGDAIFAERHPELAGAAPGQSQADPAVVDFSDYFK